MMQITMRILHETEHAVRATDGTPDEAVWLPKSQIEIEPSATLGLHEITLPEWLAKEKELI